MSTYHQPLPAPQGRPVRRGSLFPVFLVLSVLALFVLAIGFMVLMLTEPEDGIGLFGKRVAVVEIFGTIFESQDWIELIEDCADSDSIAAVVLHIDSPGGAITPTQEIYEAAKKISKEGKPVIAFMGSVAASGGYYAACAADEIYAMPGTLTGSIGVYMQMVNVSDLLQKLGIEFDTVKKGAFKTAGDFSRSMKPEERAMFLSVVEDYYGQFLEAVSESRERNKISLARGWNENLPGGSVESASGTADLGGLLYPSSAWAGAGMSISAASIAASTGSAVSDGTATATASAKTDEEMPKRVGGIVTSEASAEEVLWKMFAEGLTPEAIHKRVGILAEGRIYTGRQAMKVGLVDRIGTLDDAVDRAGELAGIGKKPKKVTKEKKEAHGLFGIKMNSSLFEGSRFLYLCPLGM